MTPSDSDIIRQGDHTLTSNDTIRQWYYQARRSHIDLKWHHQTVILSGKEITHWPQVTPSDSNIIRQGDITHWPEMTPSDSDIIRQGDHTLTSNDTIRQWYYQARRSHIGLKWHHQTVILSGKEISHTDLKWHHQTVILSGKEITHWPQVTPSDSNIIRQGDITHWPEMTPSDSDIIRACRRRRHAARRHARRTGSHIDLKWHHQTVILSGKEITHWPQVTPSDSNIIRQGDHTLASSDTIRQ